MPIADRGALVKTEDFHYDLPEASIAQKAIEPRDAARLLDTRDMSDHRFRELPELLAPGDLVVVNRTRVRRARLRARKETGGAVELLLLRAVDGKRWEALARPTRRLRDGTVLRVGDAVTRLVGDPAAGRVLLESDADLAAIAAQRGEIPLPPYFHGTLDDDERYQTVFGDRVGSAAAPTAALHFTPWVVDRLRERGVGIARVELEVGLDTFRPIAADRIEDHEMHAELITVNEEAADQIAAARAGGSKIVAIGTTVVRTLESAWRDGEVRPFAGDTKLFITPGHRFEAVDLVVTNFHVPGSTLVVLAAALLGDRWRSVYETALDRDYRFLSFGDAMLAQVPR